MELFIERLVFEKRRGRDGERYEGFFWGKKKLRLGDCWIYEKERGGL